MELNIGGSFPIKFGLKEVFQFWQENLPKKSQIYEV